jgi:hypothetical protein
MDALYVVSSTLDGTHGNRGTFTVNHAHGTPKRPNRRREPQTGLGTHKVIYTPKRDARGAYVMCARPCGPEVALSKMNPTVCRLPRSTASAEREHVKKGKC